VNQRRAQLIGTGLIGGSVGLALRRDGWFVTGHDTDITVAARARDRGAVDTVGDDAEAELVVIAAPVGSIPSLVEVARDRHPDAVITDVGSVKGPVVEAVDDPNFVGGHPMAGSEQSGVDGSDASMFDGAVWVLTPTESTTAEAFALVHSVAARTGAEVIALDAAEHDRIVAMVSHVPHLAAATLMRLAASRSDAHSALLRLAAGGFRDMTRIAAGHPGIWPDICSENRAAIVEVLDELIAELRQVRVAVETGDRNGLIAQLESARKARLNLPTTAARPEDLVEVRVVVADHPGQLALVTTRASELGVNIYDIEMAHSAEGPRGVMILVIDASMSHQFAESLASSGYRVSLRPLR
jgi:prephenate dehydrogenase